jgi:hypothetical protein
MTGGSDLTSMDREPITCDRVDRDDLDTRYLAGSLDEALAEAFEAHYFGCDRCWQLVHGGVAVRSAGRPRVAEPAPAVRRRPPWLWPAMAIAAGLGIWAVGAVTRGSVRSGPAPLDSTVRGSDAVFALTVRKAPDSIVVSWPRHPAAASYRLRVYTDDGDLLGERRAADTVVSISPDSVASTGRGSPFFQVDALDRAGAPLARSPLVPIPADSARR